MTWRSQACSMDCWNKFWEHIDAEAKAKQARRKARKEQALTREEEFKERMEAVLPERLDMTQEEVIELTKKPREELREEAIKELEGYDMSGGFVSAMEEINKEIDEAREKEVEKPTPKFKRNKRKPAAKKVDDGE